MIRQINRAIGSGFSKFFVRYRDRFKAELQVSAPQPYLHWFEWYVVAFAIGIGIYFAWPYHPNLWICLLLAFAMFSGWLTIKVLGNKHIEIMALLAFMFFGLLRAGWHTEAVNAPILPDFDRAYTVSGWIYAKETSGSRDRWTIKITNIEELKPDRTPVFIRTTVFDKQFSAGDTVKVRSILSSPPGPAIPGGYDPSRRAFFRQIGGYGYAISKASSIELERLSVSDQLKRRLVRIRYGLAERILEQSPDKTAGLQVALLTGIRGHIPEEQTDALRIAGLAHVLAISGLHMGLMSGSVFFLVSLCLACITPLSRRTDVRKPAAIIGALAATAYLALSGASVATQRAYIMTLIVFLAVILDRRAFSLRSVALAGAITLMWHPEALMSAGFQMSFSAVGALVVVYRALDRRTTYQNYSGLFGRLRRSFAGLSITSFVAGTATAGFAALHFNRMATFGLAGNLLAMPIFTAWVMPLALGVFIALPFGLEAYPLALMGLGLELMLVFSNYVSGWPNALTHVAGPPGWIIGFYGLCFLLLCLGNRVIKLAGFLMMGLCLILWAKHPQPDMRISDVGAIAFWEEDGSPTLYVDRRNADRYGREQFTEQAGVGNSQVLTYKEDRALCDALACRISLKGYDISIISHPSEVIGECETSDLVVLTQRSAGPVARRICQAKLIDMSDLKHGGGHNVYLTDDTIRLTPALTARRKRRPWG